MNIDSKAIMAQVKANIARLDGCAGPHDFHERPEVPRKLFAKRVCSKCGGEISSSDFYWYQKGLAHAAATMLTSLGDPAKPADWHGSEQPTRCGWQVRGVADATGLTVRTGQENEPMRRCRLHAGHAGPHELL